MTADVRIHIETAQHVLSLPIEAVVKEAGKSYVTKVDHGDKGKQKTDKVEVKVGARNDREIEIASRHRRGRQGPDQARRRRPRTNTRCDRRVARVSADRARRSLRAHKFRSR